MPNSSNPSLHQIQHALEVFHGTTDDGQRKQAEKFLADFEETDAAWQICHVILDQSQDLKCRHFAARTFKQKVGNSFTNLNANDKVSIRDMILHHVARTCGGEDRAVMVALCVALADLALQMPSWTEATKDVIARYGDDAALMHVLLEILTVIPEEMGNDKLRLSTSRRSQLKDEMKRTGSTVVALLNAFTTRPDAKDPEIMARIYDCLGSWCNIGALSMPETMNISLLQNLFLFLNNIETPLAVHDACSRCLVNALPDLVHEASASKTKLDDLVNSVLQYEDLYCQAMQKEDTDRCKNYVRIFAELAESLTDKEEGSPEDIFMFPRLLELMLVCCSHPDYEIIEMVVDFWPSLCESVNIKNDEISRVLRNCYGRLMVALWKGCRYDPDGDWLVDVDDDFEGFRRHVWDCVFDMTDTMGYTLIWETLMQLLSTNQSHWDAVESSLFLMSALAEKIPGDDNVYVTPIVAALIPLMGSPSKLCFKHTVLTLFGHLAQWFGKHPDYTDKALAIIAEALPVAKLSDPASWALQELSRFCRSHLTSYFHQLMRLLKGLETQALHEDEMESVSKAIVNILNEMPCTSQLTCLRELCDIMKSPLEKIIEHSKQNNGSSAEANTRKLQIWLNNLGAVFKHLDVQSNKTSVADLINGVWPVLGEIAVIYVNDNEVMEKVVRCLRYMVRFLGKESGIALLPIFAKFTDLYATAHHSCILYLASVLIDEFGDLPAMEDGFIRMIESMCGPTFAILNSENAVRQNPDIIEDFFRVCRRCSERSVAILLNHSRMEDILKCSLICCTSNNHNASHAVFAFWSALLDRGSKSSHNRSHLDGIVVTVGQEMIAKAVLGVFADICAVPDVAQLIYDLHNYDSQLQFLPGWLDRALELLPTPYHSANEAHALDAHVKEFRHAILNPGSLDSKVAALSTFTNTYR